MGHVVYENGSGVLQDYVEAAKFYRQAAEQGHAMARNNLGWLYKKGLGVSANWTEALKWFQKSAEQGEPLGEENLAWLYAQGSRDEFDPNYGLAETWMRKTVDLDSAEGQFKFGNLLYHEFTKDGHQYTNSFPAVAKCFEKAAEQGYAQAQYQLAEMYHSGELGDDQRSNCVSWFLKAAAQGNTKAQAVVGELLQYYPNNPLLKSVDAIEALHQTAESGDLNAQYQLARRYQAGIGVPQDSVQAFNWMKKAAEHNQPESSKVSKAIYALALMYEKGEGVQTNQLQANNLFLEAAGGHQDDATFRAGQIYEKGEGVLQDDHKAVEFYSNKIRNYGNPGKYPNGFIEYGGMGMNAVESLARLLAQGRGLPTAEEKAEPGFREPFDLIKDYETSIVNPKIHFYIGEVYFQGKLVPQDLVEADARFRLAAKHGLEEANKKLEEIANKMSPEQIKAAETRHEALEKSFEQAADNAKRLDEVNQRLQRFKPW